MNDIHLTPEEARVLGVLIEKQMTTPEYYPMSLNALTNACNQKNNREPIMSLTDERVVRALDGLRDGRLAAMVTEAGGRVPKYKHLFTETVGMDERDAAIFCELLLRGPQTLGELRSRAERMAPLDSLEVVESTLFALSETKRLVVKLPRQPGTKEPRYAHVLCGQPETTQPDVSAAGVRPEPARVEVQSQNDRIARLEAEVAALRLQFNEFRKQFE